MCSDSYIYDANGNMTLRVEISGTQRMTYTQLWDDDNRLITVSNTANGQVTRYTYDGDGKRVLQTLPDGTKVAYAGPIEVSISTTQRITKRVMVYSIYAIRVGPR